MLPCSQIILVESAEGNQIFVNFAASAVKRFVNGGKSITVAHRLGHFAVFIPNHRSDRRGIGFPFHIALGIFVFLIYLGLRAVKRINLTVAVAVNTVFIGNTLRNSVNFGLDFSRRQRYLSKTVNNNIVNTEIIRGAFLSTPIASRRKA